MEPSATDEFNSMLIETIDLVLRECLGDVNAEIVTGYLEKRSCPMSDVPRKPDLFSNELRLLLGFGKGQILGSGAILEEAIANVLCYRMGVIPSIKSPVDFAKCVRDLRKMYFFSRRLRGAQHARRRINSDSVGILRNEDVAVQTRTGGEQR